MTLQYSVAGRNAMLDTLLDTILSTSPVLKIRSGSVPATCATADAGTVLASITCPATAFSAASSGAKAKTGTWQDTSADATGTAAHFRLYKSDGSTCVVQGTVTATGGGGDMTVDNVSFAAGQDFTVTGFTITAGNA